MRVEADEDTLVHDYRMVNLLKAEVDPHAVQEFTAAALRSSCGKRVTRDQFLAQGFALRHNYYDKADQLITIVEVTADTCGAVEK